MPGDDKPFERLTSFYWNLSPEENALGPLLEVYADTVDYLVTVLDEARATLVPGKTPLLHTVPYFKVPVRDAWYPRAVAQSIEPLAFEEQIKWLDEQRLFVPFVFGRHDGAKVYDLELREAFDAEESLGRMRDYFLRDNKLYLLPEYILGNARERGALHAFDIKVDLRLLERVWGGPYGIEPGPLLTRHEYRNVVEAYHHVMQSELTIKDITASIRRATGWDSFKIEDRLSPRLDVAKTRLYDDMYLSPATFIVALPESLTKDKVRINVALGLVDPAKQSQTTYYFFMEVYRTDTLEPEEHASARATRKETDAAEGDEARHVSFRRKAEDDVFDRGRYDANTFFDESGPYASMYDNAIGKDIHVFAAFVNLYHGQLGLPPVGDDADEVDVALDALSDRFNTRSDQYEGEDDHEYRVRRLKAVLREDDPRFVAKLFDGYEVFRYDPAEVTVSRPETEAQPATEATSLVYRTAPEIPREFRAEPYYSSHRVAVRPNTDGTTGFRLEASVDGTTWTTVETAANVPGAEKVTFTLDVAAGAARYYRVRSYVGATASLPTLPIDIDVITS